MADTIFTLNTGAKIPALGLGMNIICNIRNMLTNSKAPGNQLRARSKQQSHTRSNRDTDISIAPTVMPMKMRSELESRKVLKQPV